MCGCHRASPWPNIIGLNLKGEIHNEKCEIYIY